MISTLSDAQARDLLQSARIGRLGCIANGEPYIVPINFYFENSAAYSHSLAGLKIESLRQNPRACVQVDAIENDLRWSSVLAFGNFEEIVNETEREEILHKFLNRFPLLTPVESEIAEAGTRLQVIVFRIRIDRITGVSEG